MRASVATAIGFAAVVMWSALALLTKGAGPLPPFQMIAMTFAIAFVVMAGKWMILGGATLRSLRRQPAIWLLGIGALFGFHALYFLALRLAPAAEASLVVFLWPLLVVLFSTLLPGAPGLRPRHIVGVLFGFSGCLFLISSGTGLSFEAEYLAGYLAAAGCAVIWSGYSVTARLFDMVPSDTVGWFCGATAILGWICHMAFESWTMPTGTVQWASVVLLGLGPVGVAFLAWDIGVKRGDLRLLGILSYAAPPMSGLLLVAAGQTALTGELVLACLAIAAGAAIASWTGSEGQRAPNSNLTPAKPKARPVTPSIQRRKRA